jgi:hypothetical protein
MKSKKCKICNRVINGLNKEVLEYNIFQHQQKHERTKLNKQEDKNGTRISKDN